MPYFGLAVDAEGGYTESSIVNSNVGYNLWTTSAIACPGVGTKIVHRLGISAYCTSQTGQIRLGIYDSSNNLLAQSSVAKSVPVGSGAEAWIEWTADELSVNPLTLTGGQSYKIFIEQYDQAITSQYGNTTTDLTSYNSIDYSGGSLPSTIPTPTSTWDTWPLRIEYHTSYFDAFTGSNGSLIGSRANWSAVNGNLQIYDNGASSYASGGSGNCCRYSGGTFAEAHYSRVVLKEVGTFNTGHGPAIRCQSGAASFYYAYHDYTYVYNGQCIAGSSSDWDSGIAEPSQNDVAELAVDFVTTTTIHYKVNGGIVATYTSKNALSGGSAGICAYYNNSYSADLMDDWQGGDVKIGLVQNAPIGKHSNDRTDETVSFSVLPTEGNTIVVFLNHWNGGTQATNLSVTDNQGNPPYKLITSQTTQSTPKGWMFVCECIGPTSGTFTITATWTNNAYPTMGAAEFAGVGSLAPIDTDTIKTNSTGGAYSISVTSDYATDSDDALIVGQAGAAWNSGDAWVHPSGYTTMYDQADESNTYMPLAADYRILSSSETPSATWAEEGSHSYDSMFGMLVALYPRNFRTIERSPLYSGTATYSQASHTVTGINVPDDADICLLLMPVYHAVGADSDPLSVSNFDNDSHDHFTLIGAAQSGTSRVNCIAAYLKYGDTGFPTRGATNQTLYISTLRNVDYENQPIRVVFLSGVDTTSPLIGSDVETDAAADWQSASLGSVGAEDLAIILGSSWQNVIDAAPSGSGQAIWLISSGTDCYQSIGYERNEATPQLDNVQNFTGAIAFAIKASTGDAPPANPTNLAWDWHN